MTRSSGGDWRRGTGLAALLVPLLGVLACHSAPTRGADSGVGLTKAAVPSTIDWDRVASGLELVRDEYGEQIEDGKTDSVPALLTVLDDAREQLGTEGPDPLGLRVALLQLRGQIEKIGPPRPVSRRCVALLEMLAQTGKLENTPRQRPDLEKGGVAYRSLCAPCHGSLHTDSHALPAVTATMSPRPTNPNEVQQTPSEAFHRITYGGAGTAMPAFGPTVAETTRWDLAYYLFAERWGACEQKVPALSAKALATLSDHDLWKRYGFGASACLRRTFY